MNKSKLIFNKENPHDAVRTILTQIQARCDRTPLYTK